VVLGLQGGEEGVREEMGRRRELHTHTHRVAHKQLNLPWHHYQTFHAPNNEARRMSNQP
jgi:hypothetical protein